MDTGLPMTGGFLRPLPPSASKEDINAAINGIISKLNSWNGVIVLQGTLDIQATGLSRETFSVAHNLGYAPVPSAYLNSVDISGGGGASLEDVNIPLPTWLSVRVNSGGSGIVDFPIWLSIYTDATNFYVDVFNGTGGTSSTYPVSYYLMRISADR